MGCLRRLIGAVQRDHLGAGLVAGAGIALERPRPEIAQVPTRIVDGKSLVDRVDDPIRLQDLDAPLVGVDAVLGDKCGPAGLDRGACGKQAGIAGGHRMINAGRRQRKRQRRDQAAEQRAPGPEEVQERFVRHLAIVEIADQVPRQGRVQQVGSAPRLHERSQQPDDAGELGEAAARQEDIGGLVERHLIERAWPVPAAVAIGLAEIEMMQRDHIRQRAVFRLRRRRLRQDRDDAEAQVGLATDQPMHPRGNAARDVRVGAFDDDADVGVRATTARARARIGSGTFV